VDDPSGVRENPLFHHKVKLGNFKAMNPIAWFREKSRQLLQLKDTTHAIALGTAIGMFFGFVPLWGFKTLLALGVSRLVRANLLATAIAATLHDVALPLMPLLLRWEYDIGYWLLSHPHELPPSLRLSHHSPSVWFHWSTFLTVGRPLLLGALIIAAPVAVATYYIMLLIVERARAKTPAPVEEKPAA
jgi:uncharacterized protein (DUF2062 family)